MPSVMKSEFSCPTCKRSTGALNQILANAGELVCSKDPSHKWNDTMAFLNLGPTMDFKVTMAVAPQENQAPLTITVPIPLKEYLEKNYGQKLSATLVGVLSQLSVNSMVISDGDLARLAERLGKRPVNSSELVGLIYAKTCEAEDAKAIADTAMKDVKAYEGMYPGRVVIELGAQYGPSQVKAQEAGMPLKIWIEKNLVNALESNWF